MKMKILIMGSLCLYFSASAQQESILQELKVGDSMPDMEFPNVINYKKPVLKISDFKDQLLILDFWGTFCTVCMQEMPRLHELTKLFPGNFSVIGVNHYKKDDKKTLEKFIAVRKKSFSFTTLYDEQRLPLLFPHHAYPHSVWIYKNKVIAITGSEAITENAIRSVLKYGKVNTYTKDDYVFKKNQPLFLNSNSVDPAPYFSWHLFTGFSPNMTNFDVRRNDEGTKITGYNLSNVRKLVLYQFAYPEFGHFDHNRVIYKVQDPANYSMDSTSFGWKQKNLYTYQSYFSPRSPAEARLILQEHLKEVFDMTIDSALVEKPCLVISKIPNKFRSIASKKEVQYTNWWDYDGQPIKINRMDFKDVIEQMNAESKVPMIDETGIIGQVDLTLPRELSSIKELNLTLSKFGLQVQLLPRKLYYLVLSEPELTDRPITSFISLKQ